MNTFMGVGYS